MFSSHFLVFVKTLSSILLLVHIKSLKTEKTSAIDIYTVFQVVAQLPEKNQNANGTKRSSYHWSKWSAETSCNEYDFCWRCHSRTCLRSTDNQQVQPSYCLPGYSFETEQLYIIKERQNWHDAKKNCENYKLSLWRPFDGNTDGNTEDVASLYKIVGSNFWVGFSDEHKEGVWVDSKGVNAAGKVRWHQGQPNGGRSENGMEVFNSSGVVNDIPVTELRRTVCSYLVSPSEDINSFLCNRTSSEEETSTRNILDYNFTSSEEKNSAKIIFDYDSIMRPDLNIYIITIGVTMLLNLDLF